VARREAPYVSQWLIGAAFWLTVALVVIVRETGVPENAVVGTFGIIFTSIVVEALPFILLGSAVSAAIAVLVSDRALARLGNLPRPLQLPAASLAGAAFPVCECGSVPVGRRLIARGVYPGAGIGFMLAAPVINPIVLASTWVAYEGRGQAMQMTLARAGLGLAVAMVAGWAIGRLGSSSLLRDEAVRSHDHESPADGKAQAYADHLVADFLFMGRYLVLGAAASAAVQTVVPQTVISGVAGTLVLSALAMMALAFVLSLCSEADAFVASSFTAFPLGAQLAFLVFGPVLDTKLAVLYGASFRRHFALRVLVIAAPIALGGSLLFEGLVG
jgi:uncharacterized membrane protein YraQ (UPF0718 family)